jgi:hypothetical protein
VSDDFLLMIPCVERCGLAIVAKLPLAADELEDVCAMRDWFVSVMSSPGTTVTTGVLCPECAARVHAPGVLAEMRRRRRGRATS